MYIYIYIYVCVCVCAVGVNMIFNEKEYPLRIDFLTSPVHQLWASLIEEELGRDLLILMIERRSKHSTGHFRMKVYF